MKEPYASKIEALEKRMKALEDWRFGALVEMEKRVVELEKNAKVGVHAEPCFVPREDAKKCEHELGWEGHPTYMCKKGCGVSGLQNSIKQPQTLAEILSPVVFNAETDSNDVAKVALKWFKELVESCNLAGIGDTATELKDELLDKLNKSVWYVEEEL